MRLTPKEIEEIKGEHSQYTEGWERGYREGWNFAVERFAKDIGEPPNPFDPFLDDELLDLSFDE